MFFLCVYFVFFLILLFSISGVIIFGTLDRCGLGVLEYFFCFDIIGISFLIMLFFCGVMSLTFCCHYLGGYKSGYVLYWSMAVFLFIMCCLTSSYSYITSLVMWEYLGLVSFLLILYYSNSCSLRATLITLFASRFGDVAFFFLLLFNSFWFLDMSLFIVCPIIGLIVLSKSAAFPFISWLLEAMRAPTPVSSLVHSSTLVAAGVWFIFRYEGVLGCSSTMINVLMLSCLVSILVSSFCSLVFLDLKKIVALSTCNNISWCLVFFLAGDINLGLMQLLTHGVCKCFLFISLGDLMSCSGGGQDSRGMFSLRYVGLSGVCIQGLLVLSLCGLPFLGVFFGKHLFFSDIIFSYNFPLLILLFSCFFLSYVYSFRLLSLLWGISGCNTMGISSCFLAVLFCSVFGSVCNYFFCFNLEEFIAGGLFLSLCMFFLQVLGSFLGIFLSFFYYPSFSFWGFVVWGCEWLVSFFYSSFVYFFSFSYLVCYRWELCGGVYLYDTFSFFVSGSWWLYLKVMVLGVFSVVLVLYYFFCCLGV